jgi:arylsulfatase A-like enzyme
MAGKRESSHHDIRMMTGRYDLPENAPLQRRAMRQVRTGVATQEAAFREIQAVYYGMMSKVDWLLGRVLEALEPEDMFSNQAWSRAILDK